MTLDIITHPALAPHRHGFFGRAGGASSGVYEGLNCGFGSSDQTEAVTINRARVAEALGAAPQDMTGVHQVHSARAVTVDAASDDRPEADAMVTATPGVALSVLSADCQPVLFADAEASVIGAAHAGWRGALDGVLEATVDAMEAKGARRANISAVIGPSISQRAYEVGPEFRAQFLKADAATDRFFVRGQEEKWFFDLPGFGLFRLNEAGVGQAHWTGHCTYSDPERFFSYRRATHRQQVDYGRLIAAITL